MQIELVNVGRPYVDGKLTRMEVEYIRDGKNAKAKLVGIGKVKETIQALQQFNSGDHVDVTMVKNGDYWNWEGVSKIEAGASEAKKTSYKKESTYETPEERAQRQVYIVRQSSIANAIALFGAQSVTDTLKVAQQFTDFVFNGTIPESESKKGESRPAVAKGNGVPKLKDDIPF